MDDLGQLAWAAGTAGQVGLYCGPQPVGWVNRHPDGNYTGGVHLPEGMYRGVAIPPGCTLDEAQARVVDGYNHLLALQTQAALAPARDILGNVAQWGDE